MQSQGQQSIDRLMKISNLIQSNSQFFTVLKRCLTDQQGLQRDTLQSLQQYMEQKKVKLNQQSLRQAIIQVTYFIFTCRRFNIYPQITKQDIRIQQFTFKPLLNYTQKRFSIIIYYKISDQKQLQPLQSIAIIKQIYAFLFNYYSQYVQYFKQQLNALQSNFLQSIQKFKKQVEYLLTNPKIYEPNKQKQFFLCLQQTQLFKESSNLLKIKNCSLLDLIKTNQNTINKFKQSKQKDIDLVIAYGNEKKKPKLDHDKIKQKQKQIQLNILNLFKYLQKSANNNQMISEEGNNQNNNPSKIEKQQLDKMKIVYLHREKIHQTFYNSVRKILPSLPQSNMFSQQVLPKPQDYPQMEYIIEYSSQRNSICVRLIPNFINIHIENSDFLMYQANILTFQTANVNIELVETVVQNNMQKKSMKKLAFKGTSCLNAKQPPLQKILLLMDATMIASKICQPELNAMRVAFSGLSDHQRLNLISNKINHYTKIFLKCAKKVYSQ